MAACLEVLIATVIVALPGVAIAASSVELTLGAWCTGCCLVSKRRGSERWSGKERAGEPSLTE